MSRESDGVNPGRLVVRPDSGDPKTIDLQVLEALGECFAVTENAKGYKELDTHIRIIQGDGITYKSLKEILEYLKQHKWSAENIAFGSGGGLLQKMDRDTQKCAFKCSHVTFKDGSTRDVFKNPITDPGKKSKKGRLTLHRLGVEGEKVRKFLSEDTPEANYVKETSEIANGWVSMQFGAGDVHTDMLVEVFRNGHITQEYSFDSIRRRAKVYYDGEEPTFYMTVPPTATLSATPADVYVPEPEPVAAAAAADPATGAAAAAAADPVSGIDTTVMTMDSMDDPPSMSITE